MSDSQAASVHEAMEKLLGFAKTGKQFIGIEIEPKYFDIACERIRKAYDQPDFFVAPPEKVKQECMI